MPALRKSLITHTDLFIESFPWDEVRRLSGLGVNRPSDICAQLGIPVQALTNKRQLDTEFDERWKHEVGWSRSDSIIELLTILWAKARDGDRPAVLALLGRLDPEIGARVVGDAIQVNADKAMILTGQRREDKLAAYRNEQVHLRTRAEVTIVEA